MGWGVRGSDGPDFICIGSQRAGTGYLYDMLSGHRDVWMPPFKELHYFDDIGRKARRLRKMLKSRSGQPTSFEGSDKDLKFLRLFAEALVWTSPGESRKEKRLRNALRKLADLEQAAHEDRVEIESEMPPPPINREIIVRYQNLFTCAGGLTTGDITPGYAVLPSRVVEELASSLPQTKILYILREPVARLLSQARIVKDHDPLSSLDSFKEFCEKESTKQRSFQSEIYTRWRAEFGERLHVLFFDDLRDSPENFFSTVCDVLEISPVISASAHPLGHNRKAGPTVEIDPEIRDFARLFLAGEHDRLADLVGGPALEWRASSS